MESDHMSIEETEKAECEDGCKCHSKKISKTKSVSFKCVIYDCEARSQKELIKLVCNNYKNFSFSNSLKSSNLIWFGKAFYSSDVEMCMELKGYINRVPGAELYRNKATQCRILNQLYQLFPEEFKFHPRSFILPKESNELKDFMKENPKNYLIGKPAEGSCGGGIIIFKSIKEMTGSTFRDEWVVQNYVMNPLLINKK